MNKIVVIGPGLSMGGVERASSNTINSISEQNSDVESVFISIFRKEHFFKLNSKITIIEPNGFNEKSMNIIKTILYLRQNSKLISKESKVAILVFGKFYAALVALALFGLDINYTFSDRQSPLFKWAPKIKWMNRIAFSLKPPTGVIAQTSIAASYQKKYFKKSKIKVIPNILRPITLHPEIERKDIILAVGRLGDYLKGFDLLIESFSLLKNQNWELHIAGGDENGQELKTLASKLGVINRIKFLGKVKEIDKVYAYAGIFVIPSRSEGFPNALAEAMAAGCPCIAFDFIAGPRDMIINNSSGMIVENGNLKKMAFAIDELVDNPERRLQLGQEASKIAHPLNPKIITNEIIEFLELK
jgi:glycosyltransferase involved in cell wall biosynthesis